MSGSNGSASGNRLLGQHSELLVTRRERSTGSAAASHSAGRGTSGLGAKAQRVWIITAAAVVLIAGLGFASLPTSESTDKNKVQPRILAVRTVSVQPVNSYQTARKYTGTIVARRVSELGLELAGRLTELHVDEGDAVTAGTALAELDTEHLETKRRQVVASRAQAAAQLDEMIAGPREEDIAAARARVESLQAQVALLKLQSARSKRLVAENASSQDEYERYIFGLKAQEAQLNESQYKLDELLNGTRKERIAAQRAVVSELDAAIAEIDVDLRKSTLRAPFNGTIARRLADEGTVVQVGHPILRLVEDQTLEAWIGMPAHATGKLSEGSKRRVKSQGQFFDATVAGRFPEVDPATRTRTIVLELDRSASEHVVHGQVVRLELEETVEASGFWLPSTALAKGARGLWSAFVVTQAGERDSSTQADLFHVQRRDLEVLYTQSDRVLVRGTLDPGDRVITSGTHRVVPGQLVRLTQS